MNISDLDLLTKNDIKLSEKNKKLDNENIHNSIKTTDNKSDSSSKENISSNHNDEYNQMLDIRYICQSNHIINEALRNNNDIAQMPNGDIIVTEVKTIHTKYSWDKDKDKMIKICSY